MTPSAANPPTPTDEHVAPHRRLPAVIAIVSIVVLVAAAVAMSLPWREGPAMIVGEVIGLVAPLAMIGIAAVALYAVWNRIAAAAPPAKAGERRLPTRARPC